MSEYTVLYLREKGKPLLKYRSMADEKTSCLTKEEYSSLYEEVMAYNRSINEGLGCELFYLGTSKSRELQCLPWSPDPQLLTTQMLQEILDFYTEKIVMWQGHIKRNEEKLVVLENRIRTVNIKLYDHIDHEISSLKTYNNESRETIEDLQLLRSKFEFIHNIMSEEDNAKRYELVYTKS